MPSDGPGLTASVASPGRSKCNHKIDRMQGLPAGGQPETVALYGVVLVVFGCLKSWVSPDMKVTKTPWQCCDIHC